MSPLITILQRFHRIEVGNAEEGDADEVLEVYNLFQHKHTNHSVRHRLRGDSSTGKQPTGAEVRPVLITAQQHQARARHVTTFQLSHVTETPLTALLSNLSSEILTVNVDAMMTGLWYRLQYQACEFWRPKRAPSLWKYEDL